MVDEIVKPDDVTGQMLQDLLESAYIESRLDDDGEVCVSERYKFWVCPFSKGKRIRMVAVFHFRSDTTLDERVAFANSINDELIVIRASVPQQDPDTLLFDYYFSVDGGVTRRAIVHAVKLFSDLLGTALQQDKDSVIQ